MPYIAEKRFVHYAYVYPKGSIVAEGIVVGPELLAAWEKIGRVKWSQKTVSLAEQADKQGVYIHPDSGRAFTTPQAIAGHASQLEALNAIAELSQLQERSGSEEGEDDQ